MRIYLYNSFTFLLFLILMSCSSNNPVQTDNNNSDQPNEEETEYTYEWLKTYSEGVFDKAHQVISLSNDGYLIVGSERINNDGNNSIGSEDDDIFIAKINLSGEIDWSKSYGGSDLDVGYSVKETNDNGFIVAGSFKSNDGIFKNLHDGSRYRNIFVLKINSLGEKEWIKTFSNSGQFSPHIITTSDNGYLVGSDDNPGINLLKLDQNGEKEWLSYFPGRITSLIEENGSYIFTGFTGYFDNSSETGWDVSLVKVDSQGNKEWSKTFTGTNQGGNDFGESVISTLDGGYAITGSTGSYNGDFYDFDGVDDIFLIKTDSEGNKEWVKMYGGESYESGNSLKQTPNGNFVIVGNTNSETGDFEGKYIGGSDAFILQTDSEGNLNWSKVYGTSEDDNAISITFSPSGEYVITGQHSNDYNQNIYLMKVDPSKVN